MASEEMRGLGRSRSEASEAPAILSLSAFKAPASGRPRTLDTFAPLPAARDPSGPILLSDRDLIRIARALPSPAPVGSEAARSELAALRRLQDARTPAQVASVRFWDGSTIALRWPAIAREAADLEGREGPGSRSTDTLRASAFAAIALHDAIRAARVLDARFARPSPSELDRGLVPVDVPAGPRGGAPSLIAAASTAAAEVLAYLIPSRAESFRSKAAEASASQLFGGRNHSGEVAFGERLGQAVAAVAIRRAVLDHAPAVSAPDGLGGLRVGPGRDEAPPLPRSPRPILLASMASVAPLQGTPEPMPSANGRGNLRTRTGTTRLRGLSTSTTWEEVLRRLQERRGRVLDPLRSACEAAYLLGSMSDATLIARAWLPSGIPPRPFAVDDPARAADFAAAVVLARFFPSEAAALLALAESPPGRRAHPRGRDKDRETAAALGRAVGRAIVARDLGGH